MKASNKISLIVLLFVFAVSSCSKFEPLNERKFVQSEEVQDKAMRGGVETASEDGITDPDHDEDHDKDKIVVIK
jgi:hypothetical protein